MGGSSTSCQLSRSQYWLREDAGGLLDYFRIADHLGVILAVPGQRPKTFCYKAHANRNDLF